VALDHNGTPGGLIEMLRRVGGLALLDEVAENQVLIEYPFAEGWREETGCRRFVRLREPVDGCEYALVRAAAPGAER
jgi:hypothetical protein